MDTGGVHRSSERVLYVQRTVERVSSSDDDDDAGTD
jgi:hypothetical protein